MSKSLKNVVNPDDVVEQYGADTLRVYEMFMGPLDASIAWSEEGLEGSRKFLDRVYRLITSKEIVRITMVLSTRYTTKQSSLSQSRLRSSSLTQPLPSS